jgi:enoyl-[acyl-carrier-protein] reductase (NADH)
VTSPLFDLTGDVAVVTGAGHGIARRHRNGARLPAGRLGTPEDLGAAVLYLVSPASASVTGQNIGIDGGT